MKSSTNHIPDPIFRPAMKSKSKLRCAVYGVSGSGKTYSSLAIASGLGPRIAVIDTERGSASKFADKFKFDVAELTTYTVDAYCRVMEKASGVYDVVIIDSLTHAWDELKQMVDTLTTTNTKFRGNSWGAWSQVTPQYRRLIDTIYRTDCHIISTMRAKTEWVVEKTEDGRTRPRKIGLAPEQRPQIEYEFDLVLEISPEHVATVIKDRSGLLQDRIIDHPSSELGAELSLWLGEGVDADPIPSIVTVDEYLQTIKADIDASPSREELNNLYRAAISDIDRRVMEGVCSTVEAAATKEQLLDLCRKKAGGTNGNS